MPDHPASFDRKVEPFPQSAQSARVIDDLGKMLELLRQEMPDSAKIHLEFDGKLHVHIDVRKGEDVTLVEARLPGLFGGLFSNVHHGSTPGHAFLHRVSAWADG